MNAKNNRTNIDELSPLKQAYLALEKTQARLAALQHQRNQPIAIVGMGCRMPGGVTTPDEFWELLCSGTDAIEEVPANRWDIDAFHDPDPAAPGKMACRYGGFLEEVENFDAQFFGISPREAMTLDPQQRLLLEVSHEALEHAGMAPDRLQGTAGGVFVGICGIDYSKRISRRDPKLIDAYVGSGNGHSVASGRLSYFFGLQGPSVSIDTACSSSLVAAHLACQSLRGGECDFALAGGVNLLLDPELSINFTKANMLAPNGRCKTFDASADGYVRGEGVGIVVLQRLSDALAKGHHVLAVIRGSAVNQDGPSSGLTVPNGPSQQAVIRRALDVAQLAADDIDYLEAHGTGTPLGDPIEMGALGAVFGEHKTPLWVGSVKTNIGHLEASAGIAGLIKVVLALSHEAIPPHLHFQTPSPRIPWDDLPLRIPTQTVPWARGDRMRRAGIGSFAFSGTNAHVVLEESPTVEEDGRSERPCQVIPISAKTPEALRELAQRYADCLSKETRPCLSDVAFTAGTGRSHHEHRLAVVGRTWDEISSRLEAFSAERPLRGLAAGQSEPGSARTAFLFSGQGSQYVGMGRELYRTEPSFRATFDECEEILRDHLERPLGEVVHGSRSDGPDESLLRQTRYTQPALFVLEYALARTWRSWGVSPLVMIGHSVGEYVAACLADVFSLEDGLKLIAVRAGLMQDLPPNGRMAAVFAHEGRVREFLAGHEDQVSIAAVNGPRQVVISGLDEAVDAITGRLESQGVTVRGLNVSRAFHSPLVEPMLDEFRQVAEGIRYARPSLKLISNLSGRPVDEEIARAEYWCRHVREPVRFADGASCLLDDYVDAFLEIGPQSTLLGLARSCLEASSTGDKARWLGSLHAKRSDWEVMLSSLAELYAAGQTIDWGGFSKGFSGRRTSLPTYPFQRSRYWLEPTDFASLGGPATTGSVVHPLLGRRRHSAADDELVLFESQISADEPSYLTDHRIWQTPVLPGTGFLEMAAAAGRQLHTAGAVIVEDVVFERAISLPDDETRIVQVALDPEGSGHRCRLFSRPLLSGEQGTPQWTLHAKGRVVTGSQDEDDTSARVDLEALKERLSEEVSPRDLYDRLSREALHYGPSFRGLRQLWRGRWEVLGRVELPEANRRETEQYLLHPALLDTALHVMAGALVDVENGSPSQPPFLPVGLDRLRLFKPAGAEVFSYATIHAEADINQASDFRADIELFHPDGSKVAVLEGLRMQRVARSMLLALQQEQSDDWFYEVAWRESSISGDPPSMEPGTWLLLADEEGVADELAAELASGGQHCVLARPGDDYEELPAGERESREYRVRPDNVEDFSRLLAEIMRPSGEKDASRLPLAGVVHLWSKGLNDDELDAFAGSHKLSCGSALHLVQALAGLETKPRLWLVTEGGQAVDSAVADLRQLAHAPLWGLGRVIAIEHPELRCVRVDLDPRSDRRARLAALLKEFSAEDEEDQVAYRRNVRHTARLVRSEAATGSAISLPDGPFRVGLAELGSFDGLAAVSQDRREPGPGEVEIEVSAAGLNFRELLRALGMLEGYEIEAGKRLGITSALEAPLGFECAGKIVSVGEAVRSVSPGDEVFAVAYGSLASHVTVNADWIVPKPNSLSMVEAATIPLAFVTASHALEHLAKLEPGQRVLIHAAAGGVGQAAVQLAKAAGAEIFATSSPGKWDVLRRQGIKHVMNSRTLDFRDQILEATGGRGVDVVLNSLSGEHIPASLAVLGQDGRFVDIGKLGVWEPQRVAAERPDVQYFNFDLNEEELRQPGLFGRLLDDLASRFESELLEPIPHRVFPVRKVRDAFRHLGHNSRVGKVVVAMSPAEQALPRGTPVHEQGTYLITGGLGALGLETARWLVDHGARHIVLTSRSGTQSEHQSARVEQLRGRGADVRIVAADVSQRQEVQRLIEQIDSTLPPLKGVVHAAGVLDDRMLLRQDWAGFERVMGPKISGAWHLHQLTSDLDFFVMFSSSVGLIGAHGQANYSAANAFLDALAHFRQASGLSALSIAWGPWDNLGMTARMDPRDRERLSQIGLQPISAEDGMAAFARLLEGVSPHVAAMRMDWGQLAATFPVRPFWIELAEGSGLRAGRPSAMLQQLRESAAGDRREMLVEHVRQQVAAVLGWGSADQVGPRQKMFDLGMDSLTSVELRHRLQQSLSCSLPLTVAFDYPNAEDLADFILQQLNLEPDQSPAAEPQSPELDEKTERLAEMSDEEVESLLAEKFKDLL